jgi:gliding motility-associated-like protein
MTRNSREKENLNWKYKHIKPIKNRTTRALLRTFMVLMGMLWFMQSGSLKAQVINNEGAAISITSGAVLQGDTLENNTLGIIENNGTIGLRGHYYNYSGTTEGNGFYNLEGNWVNTDIFNADNSTVIFMGDTIQRISSTGGELFYNFRVENTAGTFANSRIILLNNVNVTQQFDFFKGNIETDGNTLYLENKLPGALNYTSSDGSRVIGKFERGVNTAANYLFPIGSEDNYNPLNLDLNAVQTAGSVLSEFVAADPGDAGLPLIDAGFLNAADSVEVYRSDSIGYWSLTANTFESDDYNINLDGTGFLTPYQSATRVIKRDGFGDWTLDGTHNDAIGSITYRDNLISGISNIGNHYAWGCIRPRIWTQPQDTAVCDGESAAFSVVATGRQLLTYQWQLNIGLGWNDLSDGGIYSGTNADTLNISTSTTLMNGYRYRVIVTDKYGNYNISVLSATLVVNPRPIVSATPSTDTICSGDEIFIELSSTVLGTDYILEVLYGAAYGATNILDGDTIKQILINPTLDADSVVYRIVPTGPLPTNCDGTADTVVIWVEPTVEINAVNDTICDGTSTNIVVTSPNTTTKGIYYTWTATATDTDVSGYSNNDTGQDISSNIVQILDNTGLDSAIVHYIITPWTINASGQLACEGTSINIDIWVEPTVVISVLNDTICDNTSTNIAVTSPNTTTNGIRYTWTVVDNLNITGETNSIGDGLDIVDPIVQNLVNTSNSKQLVQYIIQAWSVNASDNNECTDETKIITVDIWINPTPRVFVSVLQDTICNDTYNEITLTTPSILTTGIVTFDYISLEDIGLTGNSADIGLIHNDIISDLLHNASAWPAKPLVVRYTVTPKGTEIGCADGITITDSVTVHPTPDTKFVKVDSVRCYLESNGTATMRAKNTIDIFTYQWNDPFSQTDSTASGLLQGEYIVTITDNQGCTKSDTVLIEEPNELFVVQDSLSHVSCFGDGDGYISVDPIGGNGAYTYLWEDFTNKSYIENISGGDYDLTIWDYRGCTRDTSITVIEPGQPTIGIDKSNVTCYGENDGWIEITSLATAFEWDNGATTNRIENLEARDYTVVVTFGDNCRASTGASISEPNEMISDIVSTRIICAGDENGQLDITVEGGNDIQPYTYNWFTPDGIGLVTADEDQTELSGGNYYVTVEDYRGCTVLDTAFVGEPPLFENTVDFSNSLCYGDSNAWISVVTSGGNGDDYTYSWSNTNGDSFEDTSHIEGLHADEYYVLVKDTARCEFFDTIPVSEPDLLETFISYTNSSCFNYSDGTAKIDITGGNGGYVIDWSNGAVTDSISGLIEGSYTVTVSDSENCVTTNDFDISEPEEINPNANYNNITCFGYNNGSIEFNPTGGIQPYQFNWSHNPLLTGSVASNLDPGSYSVSVIDENNCVDENIIVLTQPDPLVVDISKTDITCYSYNDGSIELSLTGGTPDYNYQWSNGITDPIAQMLSDGDYSILITDQNDCLLDTVVEIIEPKQLTITPIIRRPTCPDIQNGYIELNLAGGIEPYSIYWDDGGAEENLYDIRSGVYELYVNDFNLCELDTSFVIRSINSFCIRIPTAITPNGDSYNERWEIDMGGLYPNCEVEIFDRWGKQIFYSKGYEESQYWNGTVNGKELPMDSYFYIINLRNGTERLSGVVTLIR